MKTFTVKDIWRMSQALPPEGSVESKMLRARTWTVSPKLYNDFRRTFPQPQREGMETISMFDVKIIVDHYMPEDMMMCVPQRRDGEREEDWMKRFVVVKFESAP